MSVIQIASNAVNAKLYGADRQAKLEVSTLLSYRVDGAEFSDACKKKHWDGRSTFFDFRNDMFPAGFVHMVYSRLTQLGHTVQIVRKPLPAPLGPVKPKVDNFPEDPRYDYQPETIDALLKHGQMVAQIATGGGKSRIARLAFARIRRPTMFLTTRSVLMYQMKDAFEANLGIRAGVMGDSEWSPRKGFNVAMVQTLAARIEKKTYSGEIERRLELINSRHAKEIDNLKAEHAKRLKQKGSGFTNADAVLELNMLRAAHKKDYPDDTWLADDVKIKVDAHMEQRRKVLKVLEYFEVVILEEAHEAASNSYYDIMRACKNAAYRLSLTATPFMKDDEEANMRLMACSGPIGIKVSEQLLIERGILASPYFKFVSLPKPDKLYRLTPWQRAYKQGVVDNEYRNLHMVFEAKRAKRYGLPVMILIQQTAHGKALKKMMLENGLKAEFIFGENKQTERQAALKRLGSGNIDVLIGSTILDVGVDVPSVGMVILGGGGKAEVSLRQRIGRGLREKKIGPNVAFIVDFMDQHNTHLSEHFKQREYIIVNTPGFGENILDPGQDFPYESLGLSLVA